MGAIVARLDYVSGDATHPQGEGMKIIPHIVNDKGRWGKGFVLALSERWDEPEREYRSLASAGKLRLGETWFSLVEEDITVANMCAQHDTKPIIQPGAWMEAEAPAAIPRPPIRYVALAECMEQVAELAIAPRLTILRLGETATIHTPRFGAGLAKGHWPAIEAMIFESWVDRGINVVVYDLP